MTQEYDRRLERPESRLAIDELLAEYSNGFDQRDAKRWLNVFHEDTEFEINIPPVRMFESADPESFRPRTLSGSISYRPQHFICLANADIERKLNMPSRSMC